MNLTENIHRKDLSYNQKYVYIAEIMKAFNDNVTLVASKLSWPESRVREILTYARLSDKVKAKIDSPDDFKNAISAVELPEDSALELLQVAREKFLSNRTVTNMAENIKADPGLKPQELLDSMKSKGTKITIAFDGEWHEALRTAVFRHDTSKQGYVEEATKRRLVEEGLGPQKYQRLANTVTA